MAVADVRRTAHHVEPDVVTQRLVPPEAWQGLSVFVVPERTSWKLDEAVAGIARGLEILEVLRLDLDRQDAVAELLGSARQFPHVAGLPHTLVVACDVPLAPDAAEGTWRTEDRVAAVARHTSRRWFGHDSPPYEAVRYVVGPREAFALLELVGDPGLETRLQAKVAELAAACAVPFPIIEMLGAESPGYRARVALVEHPVHGRAVCKIFRPGAMASFRRELHARTLLADQPLTPQLLEHGPNWLLTPAYSDNGAHRLRRLPTFAEMYQLRPWATRALAEFAHTMHERGMFVLDLSPHNLMSDPTAGLKVVDLEFARPYTDFSCPPPSAAQAWSFRGVPAQLRAGADLPALALAKGVGNSVFHPAVAGLPVKRLLKAARKRDALRRVATQSSWYAAIATVGRLSMALRRGR